MEILIDHITVGKRIPGTKDVPIEIVRNAVDFVLKAFQRLLQRGPVYVQIAGGQVGQGQHLLQTGDICVIMLYSKT